MSGDDLEQRLGELARSATLLIACDYDGTLAPIVADPSEAYPLAEAVTALRALATLPDTHVAVVSGRALRDLAVLSRLPQEVHLVGSHGSEFDLGFAHRLEPAQADLLAAVLGGCEAVVQQVPGVRLETKPASVAVHVRGLPADDASTALAAVEAGPGQLDGVVVRHGKDVIELLVVQTNKGDALQRLRHLVGASAVLFAGDDVTDEDAFRTLAGPDAGVKVGPGETAARFRVDEPTDVARLLARLVAARSSWLFGVGAVPIERHTMLSDQRTVALLNADGGVSWLCHPRVDSASVFAELLGGPSAGRFSIRPVGEVNALRHSYAEDTLVAETRWPGMMVVDYLDCPEGRPAEGAGRSDLVRVVSGRGQVDIVFAPRLDFGRTRTGLEVVDGGLEVTGSAEQLVLCSPGITWAVDDDGSHQVATARVTLGPDPLVLELRMGVTDVACRPEAEPGRRATTMAHWREWADGLQLPTVATEAVKRSALLIKGLVHEPTGAIVAAATTSLPEDLGGVRNWDYRYCWVRDASLAAASLARLGSTREGAALLSWVGQRLASLPGPDRLRPVYAVDGRDLAPEAVITGLAGYAGSRPVRIGNAADRQVQLDVFGPVAELMALLDKVGDPLTPERAALLDQMVVAVAARWSAPDQGIWEVRSRPRHHVHSKVMCWQTVDRAIAVAERHERPVPPAWQELRHQIATDVLARGWKEHQGAYGAAYDGDDLDASSLSVLLSGLLSPEDPRALSTVEAIEAALRDGPVVYRYRDRDDGLPGQEGGFVLCALWLVDCYVLLGRRADAQDLFAQVVDLAGPTGLLSEQHDPRHARALGNVPQTYSHHGLIDSALRLAAIV